MNLESARKPPEFSMSYILKTKQAIYVRDYKYNVEKTDLF